MVHVTLNGGWTAGSLDAVAVVNVRIYRDYNQGSYANASFTWLDPHGTQYVTYDVGSFHRELIEQLADSSQHSLTAGITCYPFSGNVPINVSMEYTFMAWSN